MSKQVKVLISHKISRDHIQMVQDVSPRLVLDFAKDEVEQAQKLADCEVLVAYKIPTDPTVVPKLKWLQSLLTGVNHLVGTPLMASDIVITTPSGILAIPIAEYAFASILAFCKRFPYLFQLQREREWVSFWDVHSKKLHGKTLGIVGYGSIGRSVARIATGFSMRILALKRDPTQKVDLGFNLPGAGDPQGTLPERYFYPSQVRDMLLESDFVVLTAPLTSDTEHMIGEEEFRAMKPTSYLVNVGRGQLIDHRALIKALRTGQIAGAGLDVFEVEPLPKDSELYDLDNIILTPHCSNMEGTMDFELWSLFCENLKRYLAGESLLNVVDKNLGY